MEKRLLGKTGMEVSRVVFGGIVNTNEEQNDANNNVAYAIDKGINYFDVAPTYGDAEVKLGNALEPYRKNVFLACKTIERKADKARTVFNNSLKNLKTDWFDIYQLHELKTFEDLEVAFAEGGVMEMVVQAKKEGYIKNISFSAHNEDVALKALELFDFQTVLFPLNWTLGLGKNIGQQLVKVCREKNVGILGMKSLAHRLWMDGEEKIYPKCWYKPLFNDDKLLIAAIKYTLSAGADVIVPPGYFELFSFVVEHIDECLKNPINDFDIAFLNQEIKKIGANFIM
jgi:aryl-alcohol dehydrogenase-like predicted oxidoreductase